MRTAKPKLIAAVFVSTGLLGLAVGGAIGARGQQPPTPPAKADPPPPPAAPKPDGLPVVIVTPDVITAYPDLVPTGLDDLIAKCPRMFSGNDVPSSPKDPPLRQLQAARLNATTAEIRLIIAGLNRGQPDLAFTIPAACNRAAAAATDLFTDPNDLRPWVEEWVRVAKWFEKVTDARVRAGRTAPSFALTTRYARLEAEIALYKLDQRLAGKGGR